MVVVPAVLDEPVVVPVVVPDVVVPDVAVPVWMVEVVLDVLDVLDVAVPDWLPEVEPPEPEPPLLEPEAPVVVPVPVVPVVDPGVPVVPVVAVVVGVLLAPLVPPPEAKPLCTWLEAGMDSPTILPALTSTGASPQPRQPANTPIEQMTATTVRTTTPKL